MADDTGITVRHTKTGEKRYRAEAWDNDSQRRIYKTFPTRTAARNWRRDMQSKIARGEARALEPVTIAEAYRTWIHDAKQGVVRARGGTLYKPSVLHGYEISFTSRLLPTFGRVKIGELRRERVQSYVDELVKEGLAAQTVRNIIVALRVLMKWGMLRGLIHSNPCDGLVLPSGGSTRDRIASVTEALKLIEALRDVRDRAILATAFFAGLRRGELMALRWKDVDLLARTITVDSELGNYDPRTKTFGPPKSKKGARTLGIPDLLVPYLRLLAAWAREFKAVGASLVFGRDGRPFNDRVLMRHCVAAWEKAELTPIGLHEARHTYASLMIAAGVNIKTISEWMGHSSVTITLDRYGHLLPGAAKEALGLLNNYLDRELKETE